MSGADKLRVALSPLYVVAGAAMIVRGAHEPLGWILGLTFIAYGLYRLQLVRKALAK
jgi:hypothetical protein